MAANLQGIGDLLQGMGAGFAGQGPQYMYAKQQAQEQAFLNDERRWKALNHDFAVVHQLGAAGKWDAVDSFLEQRKGFINQLDGDPSHTAGLQSMARDPAQREAFLNETLPYAASMAMDSSGQANPFQKGASFIVKDQANQMFQGSLIFDPNTGEAKTILSPIGHNNQQQGAVSMVGSAGMTPDESIINAGGKTAAEQAAIAAAAARIEAEKARGENIGNEGGNGAPSAADIAAQIQKAKDEATAVVKREEKQRLNTSQYDMYAVARDNLRSAIGAPISGPLVGSVPAITAAQQKLDTAKTLLLPVIKNMMRTAGEGSQDQREFQAMLDLIPDRKTHPEVAASNLDALDRMVRIKLGQPAQDAAQDQPAPQQPAANPMEGKTAVNPQTGQKIKMVNGQWVPM